MGAERGFNCDIEINDEGIIFKGKPFHFYVPKDDFKSLLASISKQYGSIEQYIWGEV